MRQALFLGLLLFALATQAQSSQLDLPRAIALTIENNPAIARSRSEVAAAAAEIERSKAGYYPQVTANALYTHIAPTGYVEFPSAEGLRRSSFVAPNNYNANLSLSYTVYDFGRTRAGVDLAGNGKALAEQNVILSGQELALATIRSFYRIHYLQEALGVQDRQIEVLGTTLRQTEALRDNGEATGYEVLSTQVRISTAENTRADLENQLAITFIELERLTGVSDLTRTDLVNEWGDTTATEIPFIDFKNIDRAELQIARLQEQNASLQESLATLNFKPIISLNVAAGMKNQILPDINELRANYVAAAQVTVPIFTGYRNKYGLAEARIRKETAAFARQDTEARVTAEVQQAVASLNTSFEKIARSRLLVQQANEAAKLAELKYQNGIITNLDLLDTQIGVSQAEIGQLNTIFEYTLNTYQLKRVLGQALYPTL